ncbi:MAG: pyruvate kinase [Candidatus Hydrogenedentes bacterium]|nr:pyruvate kinase [Candidatus Hydrogenedentota bacterium]
MRRTKIVCTLGPSSSQTQVLRELVAAGMDVARLNFSHGTHESHRATFDAIRGVAAELGRNVAVLADLQGPKIRTGALQGGGPVTLEDGTAICVTTRPVSGDAACISTTYANLPNDVHAADRILLATPLSDVRETLKVIAQDLKTGCLIFNMSGLNTAAAARKRTAKT